MKILIVSHRYPPAHRSGTEQYASRLVRGLVHAGHEVAVFCAEKDISRRDLSLSERVHEEVRVHELVNNLFYDSFRQTFDHPAIEAVFADVVARERPDIVHFQHLMYLSLGLVGKARDAGAGVVFTLHDFWLECARFGQLLHADGSLCETVVPSRCGVCLTSFPFAQGALERRAASAVVAMKERFGVDLKPLAQGARARLAKSKPGTSAPVDQGRALELERAVVQRTAAVREKVLTLVDCFLAPSEFLRQRVLGMGVEPERVLHVPTGAEPTPGEASAPGRLLEARAGARRLGPPRVLCLGTLAPHKGAHVLLDAWERALPGLAPGAKLVLHGPAGGDAAYVRSLAERAAEVGAELGPALAASDVALQLEKAWLLVVPSLWFENSPLVLIEARQAGVPVLVSDLGALGELVPQGRGGWRFPPGDSAALASELKRLLGDPRLLDQALKAALPPISFQTTVERTLAIYSRVHAAARARRL